MITVERWENDVIRAVSFRDGSSNVPIGSFYSFHMNGNPREYSIRNHNGVRIKETFRWHQNGYIRIHAVYDSPGRIKWYKEFNTEGTLIRHHRYENNQMHGEQYYNVNGKELTEHWYKGVRGISPELMANPHMITKEVVLGEDNLEVRHIYLEAIGVDNYLNFFDYEVIDIDSNLNDFLYEVDLGNNKVNMVKFICPSTKKVHFHFVPLDLRTVGSVKCWMFGIEGTTFTPISEG